MLAEKQFVRRMVGIAQLVEHLVVVQDVAGSSPVTHPKRVRCELATKGPPLVAVRAWPIFFASAAQLRASAQVFTASDFPQLAQGVSVDSGRLAVRAPRPSHQNIPASLQSIMNGTHPSLHNDD